MLKAVLFDLDGTLINSEEYYMKGMATIARRLGVNATPSDFFVCIGKDMDYTYKMFENFVKQDENKWMNTYNMYFSKENKLDFKKLLFDDVLDTFKGLKEKGLKIGICSMSPVYYIEEFVRQCNLEKYVDYYISGEECLNNKPAPDIYLKALNDLNIQAEEALVVEDAKEGIEAALAANIPVIARDDSHFNVDQSKAKEVFIDLRKLLKII